MLSFKVFLRVARKYRRREQARTKVAAAAAARVSGPLVSAGVTKR